MCGSFFLLQIPRYCHKVSSVYPWSRSPLIFFLIEKYKPFYYKRIEGLTALSFSFDKTVWAPPENSGRWFFSLSPRDQLMFRTQLTFQNFLLFHCSSKKVTKQTFGFAETFQCGMEWKRKCQDTHHCQAQWHSGQQKYKADHKCKAHMYFNIC